MSKDDFVESIKYGNKLASILEMRDENPQKNIQFANLMSELEGEFQIPLIDNEQLILFKKEYQNIFNVYRLASDSRKF